MPEDRPICKCGNPMWKKQLVFPESKNPRMMFICGKCGRTRTLPLPKNNFSNPIDKV